MLFVNATNDTMKLTILKQSNTGSPTIETFVI